MSTDYCCAMRQHFILAIVGEVAEEGNPAVAKPAPAEAADFIEFAVGGGPPVIHFRFCPFCGTRIERQTTRTVWFGSAKDAEGYGTAP